MQLVNMLETVNCNRVHVHVIGMPALMARNHVQAPCGLAELERSLQKPLRPMWISQATRLWTNEVVHPMDMPFTPIILVSASLPERQRRVRGEALALPCLLGWDYGHTHLPQIFG